MVWTYNYQLPIDYTNSIKEFSKITSEPIGSDLYIFASIEYNPPGVDRLYIFVFDTKTRELQSVSYERPANFGIILKRIDTDGKNIYIWRQDRNFEKKLFKFDIKTRSMTYIVSEYRVIYNNCPIIGDNMYVLAHENGYVQLLTINLSKKKLISESRLGLFRTHSHDYIDGIRGELYLYRTILTMERTVSKIVGKRTVLLLHDHFAEMSQTWTSWKAGRITYKRVNEGTYYRDTFDFKTLSWNREESVDDIYNCSEMTSSMERHEIDGVSYSITTRFNSEYPEYGLRVFDNLPKLSTKCYLNIAEEVIQNDKYEELENLKNNLHPLINYELDEMIGWRKREKEIQYRTK